MTTEKIQRMNILSEKTLSLKATRAELDEFHVLLNIMKEFETHDVVFGLPH
jgi:hypothetical protein